MPQTQTYTGCHLVPPNKTVGNMSALAVGCGTPTWRPQSSVIIFNLLWLSKRLIVCPEETGIYIRTFPNTLTSNMGKKLRDKNMAF